jgi:prepilin-type N-terminal cleavage/methylation domain-containing protein
MRKDAGLTLLEVCVVLAVMLTLAAICTPTLLDALHSVRELLALASQVVVR